jgi:hypothetical protein
MSNHDDVIKPWRDLAARLLSQNLELQRQLEELRRVKTDSPVEDLAASALRSIRAAEAALAEAGEPGRRLVVSEMQTSFRGILQRQGESLALRLPLPEHAATPGHLGSLHLAFAHVPTPPLPVTDHAAPLAAALEKMQPAFAAWAAGPGSVAARAIVDQVTTLLSARESWGDRAFWQALQTLAEAAGKFGAGLRQLPAEPVRAYRESARAWLELTQPLARAGSATPLEFEQLALAVGQATQSLQTLAQGKRRRMR